MPTTIENIQKAYDDKAVQRVLSSPAWMNVDCDSWIDLLTAHELDRIIQWLKSPSQVLVLRCDSERQGKEIVLGLWLNLIKCHLSGLPYNSFSDLETKLKKVGKSTKKKDNVTKSALGNLGGLKVLGDWGGDLTPRTLTRMKDCLKEHKGSKVVILTTRSTAQAEYYYGKQVEKTLYESFGPAKSLIWNSRTVDTRKGK